MPAAGPVYAGSCRDCKRAHAVGAGPRCCGSCGKIGGPVDRVLAFLDMLLRRASSIVELRHPLGRSRQVGDDEADARVQLARMPLDLGHHSAALTPGRRPVGKGSLKGVSSTPLQSSGTPRARVRVTNMSHSKCLARAAQRVAELALEIALHARRRNKALLADRLQALGSVRETSTRC